MSSLLTNNGAMVALQTLKSINSEMGKTQNMISTGKEVDTAKDNAAVWSISKMMESEVTGFKAISDSLNQGASTVATARDAATGISDLLKDMKGLIVSAQDESADHATIQKDIGALRDQIGSIVETASFKGLNLIDGSESDPMKVLASLDSDAPAADRAKHIEVGRANLSVTGNGAAVNFGTRITGANADNQLTSAQGGTGAVSGTAATVATGATQVITIESVAQGMGYEVSLGEVELNTQGATAATGAATFQYVASADDSTTDVANNLKNQIEGFLKANTDGGDYSVTVGVDGNNKPTISIENAAAATDLEVDFASSTTGTPTDATSGAGLAGLATLDVTGETGRSQALGMIDGLIKTAVDAAASFGSAEGRIETQSSFISKLTDNFKSGIGAMVDANMEEVSARLQALQVQQQLATQSLSIANQAPQSILSLFR
jgi:flagellin